MIINNNDFKNLINNQDLIMCHGVFDLLHIGHVRFLKEAKKYGKKIIVTITADKFVNKGPGRPRFNQKLRAEMLDSLGFVDYVYINHDQDSINLIKKLKPSFYIKGKDYKDFSKDVSEKISKEKKTVEINGGKFKILDIDLFSSSNLLNKFFSNYHAEQENILKKIKKKYSFNYIHNLLSKNLEHKINIIGETIIDEYVFCKPENLSTKSPTISSKLLFKEEYLGGVLALYRNLDHLNIQVRLLTISEEKYLKKLLKLLKNNSYKNIINIKIKKNINKTRFISVEREQRLFEIFNVDTASHINLNKNIEIKKFFKNIEKNSINLAVDYGHGLFDKILIEKINKEKNFNINVQTNSENYGYNLITKYKNINFFVIDEREARLAVSDRFCTVVDLVLKLSKLISNCNFIITLGSQGSLYFSRNPRKIFTCPAFFDKGIDATGAGDLFFMISSILNYQKVDPELILFISNIYAGLKTRIRGNSEIVTKVNLLKTIETMLK